MSIRTKNSVGAPQARLTAPRLVRVARRQFFTKDQLAAIIKPGENPPIQNERLYAIRLRLLAGNFSLSEPEEESETMEIIREAILIVFQRHPRFPEIMKIAMNDPDKIINMVRRYMFEGVLMDGDDEKTILQL